MAKRFLGARFTDDVTEHIIDLKNRFRSFMQEFTGDFDHSFDIPIEYFYQYFIAWVEQDLQQTHSVGDGEDGVMDGASLWTHFTVTVMPFVIMLAYDEFRQCPERYALRDPEMIRAAMMKGYVRDFTLPLMDDFRFDRPRTLTESERDLMSAGPVSDLLHNLWIINRLPIL